MEVQVEATVKRLASARLNQVYAGPRLSGMMGKGKGKAPEDSPLGRGQKQQQPHNSEPQEQPQQQQQQQQQRLDQHTLEQQRQKVLSVEELCKAKEQTCMMSTCYDTVL